MPAALLRAVDPLPPFLLDLLGRAEQPDETTSGSDAARLDLGRGLECDSGLDAHDDLLPILG